ncbi:hypothetical protein ApDm4_0389 [Acetobacter pomorum]|nr:hypothetical protein ApDm4_0389 [Acetobacter pomorum]
MRARGANTPHIGAELSSIKKTLPQNMEQGEVIRPAERFLLAFQP